MSNSGNNNINYNLTHTARSNKVVIPLQQDMEARCSPEIRNTRDHLNDNSLEAEQRGVTKNKNNK